MKSGSRLSLTRGDSGYFSPLCPVTPSSEHSTPSRMSFLMLCNGANMTPGHLSMTHPAIGNSVVRESNSMQAEGALLRHQSLIRQASMSVLDETRIPGDVS